MDDAGKQLATRLGCAAVAASIRKSERGRNSVNTSKKATKKKKGRDRAVLIGLAGTV